MKYLREVSDVNYVAGWLLGAGEMSRNAKLTELGEILSESAEKITTAIVELDEALAHGEEGTE